MGANERYLFSSESVTEGHPDKVSDQISDAVLDAILEVDPFGRVACETLVTTGLCMIAGEISQQMPPNRTLPIVFKMVHPIRCFNNRRAFADSGISNLSAICRSTEMYLLVPGCRGFSRGLLR